MAFGESRFRPKRSGLGSLVGGFAGRSILGNGTQALAAGAAGYMAYNNFDDIIKFVKTAVQMAMNYENAGKIWEEAYGGKSEEEKRNEDAEKAVAQEVNVNQSLQEIKDPVDEKAKIFTPEGNIPADHDPSVSGSLRTTQADISDVNRDSSKEISGSSFVKEARTKDDLIPGASALINTERGNISSTGSSPDVVASRYDESGYFSNPSTLQEYNFNVNKLGSDAIASGDPKAILGDFDKENLSDSEKLFSQQPDLKISKMTMQIAGESDPSKASVNLEIPEGAKTYEQVMAFNAQKNPDLIQPGNVVSIQSKNDAGYSSYKNLEVLDQTRFRDFGDTQGQWSDNVNFKEPDYAKNRSLLIQNELENLKANPELSSNIRNVSDGLPSSLDKLGSSSTTMTGSELFSRVAGREHRAGVVGDELASGLQRGAALMGGSAIGSEDESMILRKSQHGFFHQSEVDNTKGSYTLNEDGSSSMEFSLSKFQQDGNKISGFDHSVKIDSGLDSTGVSFASLGTDGVNRISIAENIPKDMLRIQDGRLETTEGKEAGNLLEQMGQKVNDKTGIEGAMGGQDVGIGSFASVRSYDQDTGRISNSEIAVSKTGDRFAVVQSGSFMLGEINRETGEVMTKKFADNALTLGEDGKFKLGSISKENVSKFMEGGLDIGLSEKDVKSKGVSSVKGLFESLPDEFKKSVDVDTGVDKDAGSEGMVSQMLGVANSHADAVRKAGVGLNLGKVAGSVMERD